MSSRARVGHLYVGHLKIAPEASVTNGRNKNRKSNSRIGLREQELEFLASKYGVARLVVSAVCDQVGPARYKVERCLLELKRNSPN